MLSQKLLTKVPGELVSTMKKNEKKQKKWVKKRHTLIKNIVHVLLYPYSRIKYGLRIERLKEGKKRQYLVLYNHQTAFDQFFVGMLFKKHLYYVASEDIFSNGFVSKLIKFLVNPIPIKKQSTDVRAIMTCIKVAKEGGSIAIAPEGNRTYSGKTEYMNPSIASLARKLNLPIAFVKIEGGYGTHPRWSDVVRRGRTTARVSRIMEPGEYFSISDTELAEVIRDELYVNEANSQNEYFHKKRAQYLERAIYVCPECKLSIFESSGDTITCKRCGLAAKYTERKELISDNANFSFRFVSDWYDYQKKFILALDLAPYYEKPMYEERAMLREVIPYEEKKLICENASVQLYANRIVVGYREEKEEYSFDEASSLAVLGKNKLNIYLGKRIFQLKGDSRFNALKYVHIFYRYQQIRKGEKNGEFLGL